MGDNNPNGMAGDTLESLEAEREDFEKTIACARQVARDFDKLTEQRKSMDPRRIAFHLQLKGPILRRCAWKGIITPEAFQWHKEVVASQKVLGGQVLRDAAAFGQALISWEEDLEKREQDYRAKAQQQNVANLDMMEIDPPIASDPISESLTLVNLAGIPAMVEGVGGLVAVGAKKLAGLASDAASGLTRAAEQRLAGGAASRIVPGGGLRATENLGGHLLSKHVGKTKAQLMSRAMTDSLTKGVASTFFDRATAEAAASHAIDAHAGEFARWLSAAEGPPLRILGTMSKPVGKIVTKEGVSTITSSSVFILVRDATSSIGYYILTGYPKAY